MQQMSLFDEPTTVLPVAYYPDFLTKQEADELYRHALELQWQQNTIRMLGKTMPVPRLECIYGDEGCDYLYSKSVLLKPLPWTSLLAQLRDRITAATGYSFRIVIGNQYRSGQDSIGWHNDNEASMGLDPAIASISLGSVRKFQIKAIGGKPTGFWLEHGSLLVMLPGCQTTHLHQVPKTTKFVTTRINLTFRPHVGGKR
ncbi:alpha-ketoglutarate-dependent dioxygenase AlkB [Nostoc sp. FACHB-152]|uniref:alpha-ketoglutarate-dependent dioxygenase AlkB family protein n=1 Tax=Nostoc sp. FACHB-152 TaxID=2692837 RepID=UPI0016849F86|nr:alpha-ketoglutarate-dependent dioxygenase AlkB [Nostoc sp. FACHB-152]MBD2451366.1 alpha-ketoglutarate-dependent dioxygenase AlkB [Nostoc sp. FACHB-152]